MPTQAWTGLGGVSERERFSSSGNEGGDSSCVERKGHGKELQTSWRSTEAKEVPGRDGSPYHWILASAAERVGSSLCTGPPTINLSRIALSSACTHKNPAAMGEARVAGGGNHWELQPQTRT